MANGYIRGKQIDNNIAQNNLKVTYNSIVNPTDVTNKQYVDEYINSLVSNIYYDKLNLNMIANVATIGQKACKYAVIEFPLSTIFVKVNGFYVSVGENLDCYFSPDGILVRTGNTIQKGDFLYWNSNIYDLDTEDEIDFEFFVGYDHIVSSSGTYTLNPFYNSLVVEFTGNSGDTINIIISGMTFIAGNVNGQFVFDIGGRNEHTFTSVNESYNITVYGSQFTIWFDGFGSLIFSIIENEHSPIILTGDNDILTGDNDILTGDLLQY